MRNSNLKRARKPKSMMTKKNILITFLRFYENSGEYLFVI